MVSRIAQPQYVRRGRRRIRWYILIPLIVILLGLLIGGGFLIKNIFFPKEKIKEYSFCNYTVEESKAILSNPNNEEGDYQVKDYLLYGESLGVYAEEYVMGGKDPLYNKSIMLRNLCTGSEFVYLLGSEVDKQILIYELPVGVYEVYVSSLIKDERMFMEEEVLDSFYTVTRGGINHKVTLIADDNYFYPDSEDASELTLEKPYVFLEVTEEELPENVYDILIDPGHYTNDYGPIVEKGHAANGLIESDETLKAALVMEKVFTDAGLKVKLIRYGDELVDTYGEGGRVWQVFDGQAKYYISNHLNALDDKSVDGTEVMYSSYASSVLAETVLNKIVDNSDLEISGNIGYGNKIPSVLPCKRTDEGYDAMMMLREPGGKALGAGNISELARTQNKPFMEGKSYGAQAILIEYLYMSNASDAEKWKNNYELYATLATQGIIDYLKLDLYEDEIYQPVVEEDTKKKK
ncbi:MAG: N-acetylmuramoyl-L-alanine amidase [Erysipelotrichales bacterium]|nr:N-acetylmuramoyl-L-alanine amidase [Erysipelotrichales bacterium]